MLIANISFFKSETFAKCIKNHEFKNFLLTSSSILDSRLKWGDIFHIVKLDFNNIIIEKKKRIKWPNSLFEISHFLVYQR